jgi:hypothetical protein
MTKTENPDPIYRRGVRCADTRIERDEMRKSMSDMELIQEWGDFIQSAPVGEKMAKKEIERMIYRTVFPMLATEAAEALESRGYELGLDCSWRRKNAQTNPWMGV